MNQKKLGKKSINFTHFIMIPFEDENFLNSYNKLTEILISKNPKNFNKLLLQNPKKIHMTICVLDLKNDKNLINKVINILDENINKIKEICEKELIFNFAEYNTFNNIEKTKVIYAKMLKDENNYKLNKIINLIINELIIHGIIDKNNLNEYNIKIKNNLIYKIKKHITLLNISFLNQQLKKEKKKGEKFFNGEDILKVMKKIEMSECNLRKLNFCKISEEKDKLYEIIKSYNLY